MKKLLYIKANDIYYRPQAPFVESDYPQPSPYPKYKPICYIKKIWFGGWQIDYWEEGGWYQGGSNAECYPNKRLILYPNSIQEVCYDL